MSIRWKKKHSSELVVCQTDGGDSMHGSQLYGANAINQQKQLLAAGRATSMPLPKAAPVARISSPHSETLMQVRHAAYRYCAFLGMLLICFVIFQQSHGIYSTWHGTVGSDADHGTVGSDADIALHNTHG
jgi:hypothetical protein